MIPTLGTIKLQQLSAQHIQKLVREKQETGLAPNTIRRIRDVIRNGLNDAVRWELVARNVAKQTSTPRVPQREMAVWTLHEARRFLESIHDEPLEAAFVIALSTGMRRGEVVGLRWQDVDLEARTLTVSGAVQRINGQGLVRLDPKTTQSRRTLPSQNSSSTPCTGASHTRTGNGHSLVSSGRSRGSLSPRGSKHLSTLANCSQRSRRSQPGQMFR